MKTLDEVIEMLARGWVCDTVDVRRDALHYLKEYRKLDSLDAVAFTDDNPPLDWDELKTMEGKPVWVEWYDHKEWFLIDAIDDNELVFRAQNGFGWNCQNRNATWQAYRKERTAPLSDRLIDVLREVRGEK